MTGFVTILAALQLAVPVHCATTEKAWTQDLQSRKIAGLIYAYYDPNDPKIALSPDACRMVRRPTLMGANILAHELAHAWQHREGRPMTEREANRIANWADDGLLVRLETVLGRKAPFLEVMLP